MTRLAELTSVERVGSSSWQRRSPTMLDAVCSPISILDQEQRVDEEHQMRSITKNEPVIQQLGQIDSSVQQRLSSDPVISRAPSQSEVLMVALA